MANALASLKNLPCPAGDSCTAFQCLFSHARDKSDRNDSKDSGVDTKSNIPQSAPKVSITSHSRSVKGTRDLSEEELPRKRIKLDLDSTAGSLQRSLAPISAPDIRPNQQRTVTLAKTSASIQESNAPNTLRRKPPPTTTVSKQTVVHQVKPRQSLNVASTAPTNPLTPKPAIQPKQPNKGPETLNPRLLKKAPASHPTRVALVKALYKEYKRLNDELKKTAQGTEMQLLLSDQELIVKTLDDEQEIAIKKTSIYNTSIRNRILTYKKMSVVQWKAERSQAAQSDISGTMKPDSISPQPIETGLTPSQEVEFLSRLVYELSDLEAHGYISKAPSNDEIKAAEAAVQACGNTETCDRCTRRFQVFPGRREADGALASNGPCTYHSGKTYFVDRAPGDRSKSQRKFKCCQRSYEDEAGGCTTSPNHVFKTTDPKRLAAILNFVKTPTNPDVPKDLAVCFDCEMGYTVHGLELIRLTVVSWPAGDILLDILVQPVGEVLDLNTRFSGVRPEDMALAERCGVGVDHRPTLIPTDDPTEKPQQRLKIVASPKAARDLLFTIISAETPLIGHGLENDLNAVRLIHPTCIDTVLLWPHARGLPMRNGLKYLMETKLGRKIQVDPVEGSPEGHDSAEDARAAGDLVRLKIKDEWLNMQMKGWSLEKDGTMLAPQGEWTVAGSAKIRKHGLQ